MLTKSQVEHITLLARLYLDDEEKERYTTQLTKILEYARNLDELNTSDVPPTAHVLPLQNVFRQDVVGPHLPAEEAIGNSPDKEDGFFKVPRVL